MKFYSGVIFLLCGAVFLFVEIALADSDETLYNSPYCATSPPKDMPPEYYKWPKSDIDSYHGNPAIYYKKKMFYCHGIAPETKGITYVWPSWPLAIREDWNYPIQFLDTVAGVLTTRGKETAREVLLNGKPFVNNLDYGGISQFFPEESGKPKIILMILASDRWHSRFGMYNSDYYAKYFIDLGTSPPFISTVGFGPVSCPVKENTKTGDETAEALIPLGSCIKIQKIDKDIYVFSGPWAHEKDNNGNFPATAYKYNRKDGTVTRIVKPR